MFHGVVKKRQLILLFKFSIDEKKNLIRKKKFSISVTLTVYLLVYAERKVNSCVNWLHVMVQQQYFLLFLNGIELKIKSWKII